MTTPPDKASSAAPDTAAADATAKSDVKMEIAVAAVIPASSTKPKPKPKSRSKKPTAKPSPTKSASGETTTDPQQETNEPPQKRRRAPAKEKATGEKSAGEAKITAPAPANILIVDNGGDSLKYGWIHEEQPRRLANVTARLKHQLTVLVGDETERMAQRNPDQMYAVTRSTERGIVTNLGNQVQVWKRMLDQLGVQVPLNSEASQTFGWKTTRKVTASTNKKTTTAAAIAEPKIPTSAMGVLLLVPPHCPRVVLDQMIYVWMEDFGVSHVGVATSQVCAATPHPDFQSGCVVDLGWSATHIVPTFRGAVIAPESQPDKDSNCEALAPTVRRIPLGGRQLVNIWKYYSSYRQWNLMDQDFLMRDLFQQLAFISMDFQSDITSALRIPQGRRPFDRSFVLPDYQTTFLGEVAIPEALQRQRDLEAKEQAQHQQEAQEEDDDEDEDFDYDNTMPEEDDYGDENMEDMGGESKEKQKRKNRKRKRKEKKTKKQKGVDGASEEDDDDEDEEDDDNNKEMLRQRILRQKQEEERRRRELEAEQQVLAVSVERFTIPEVLFRPSDAGLPADMASLPQAIVQSIKACPQHFQPALFRSIQLTGGLAELPNLQERLQRDLRALSPGQFEVAITLAKAPIDQAWLGAKNWVNKTPYAQWSVSRDEWESSQKRKCWMKFVAKGGGALV